MARDFDGVNDVINCGSATVLDNLDPFTVTAWILPDTIGESSRGSVFVKATSGANKELLMDGLHVTNGIEFTVARATTTANMCSVYNTITLDVWQFVACTYSDADRGRVYQALAGSVPAEVSYNTRTVGSGAVGNDSANDFRIGTNIAANRTFDGRIAEIQVWNVILGGNELSSVMYGKPVRLASRVG